MSMKKISLGAAVWLVAVAAQAQVVVNDAWVRGTVPQQQSTGAFMRIQSASPARLLQASSALAGTVEIHRMSMQGDVMKMQAVAVVELPAGKPVDLQPGGYHLMMMGLKKSLNAGDSVPLTLLVEGAGGKRESIEVTATVRALGAPAPAKSGQ
jgi:copper(I)-binding protein